MSTASARRCAVVVALRERQGGELNSELSSKDVLKSRRKGSAGRLVRVGYSSRASFSFLGFVVKHRGEDDF